MQKLTHKAELINPSKNWDQTDNPISRVLSNREYSD